MTCAAGMGGCRPWHVHVRRICVALIEEPQKTWSPGQLAQASGCSVRVAMRILHELWLDGAIEHPRPVPLPVGPPQSVRPRRVSGFSQIRAAEGGQILRDLLNGGRPQSVIGTWLWEGRDKAIAMRQARRHEKGWRRARRSKEGLGEDLGFRDLPGRPGWLADRLSKLLRQRGRWYWPD